MDTIEHIRALVGVWESRAIDLEQAANLCDDEIEKIRIVTNAQACKSHASEIKNLLDRKG